MNQPVNLAIPPSNGARRVARWVSRQRLALRLLGGASLAQTAIAALVWVPATVLFAAYSLVFPLTMAPHCAAPGVWGGGSEGGGGGSVLVLPCVLTSGYVLCLALLLCLTPLVLQVSSRVNKSVSQYVDEDPLYISMSTDQSMKK